MRSELMLWVKKYVSLLARTFRIPHGRHCWPIETIMLFDWSRAVIKVEKYFSNYDIIETKISLIKVIYIKKT